MLISLLIPTLPKRRELMAVLLAELKRQWHEVKAEFQSRIEILVDDRDKPVTVGAKRQSLLEKASGEYIVFVDDDDWIHPEYLDSIMEILASMNQIDVIGFGGHMTRDGVFDKKFRISGDYHYSEDSQYYYRYFNHLSPIKREIAQKIGYTDEMYGEDYAYSMKLKESGLIRNWTYIDKDMYHYRYSFANSQTQNHANI